MTVVKSAWTLRLCVVLSVLAVGCGGSSSPTLTRQETELREIHEVYRHFVKSQQRPPSQLSDLVQQQYEGIYPATARALREGKYLVVWGVKGQEAGILLAYEKDTPTRGGAVVMADGTVKHLTAEEFKALHKS